MRRDMILIISCPDVEESFPSLKDTGALLRRRVVDSFFFAAWDGKKCITPIQQAAMAKKQVPIMNLDSKLGNSIAAQVLASQGGKF